MPISLRVCVLVCGLALVTGCATTSFKRVQTGMQSAHDLAVEVTDSRWNQVPQIYAPFMLRGNQTWTKDGPELDRLMLIAADDGEPIFRSRQKTQVFPVFQKDMLPNEIVELTEDSLAIGYGSEALVTASGLRPLRLSDQRAVMFDLTVEQAEQPTMQARALAFVAEEDLHLIVYLATKLHYFDKHWPNVQELMQSARRLSDGG